MKRKILAVLTAAAMTASLTACGGSTAENATGGSAASSGTGLEYKDIVLGETGTDLSTEIKFLTNRTDMLKDDYPGTSWNQYIAEFNKLYPDIKVNAEGLTDYAEESLLRLQGGDWGDIMMIPDVTKEDVPTYFLSLGKYEDVSKEAKYLGNYLLKGEVYGIPITAVGRGIVYNKKVFEEAGVTELPTTPDGFIEALQKIKDNTGAIPLYTNYAAGWTLSAWDDYIGSTATGDGTYIYQKLLHEKDPFAKRSNDTHAYSVYRILYEAVARGLTEDDYTTTDWESSKPMMNNGEIGTMVLGSWAVSQMQAAGDNADDIGYMPFPINVDGKLYSSASPDYYFGINADTDAEKQEAAEIFLKWMTERSGFSYNEGGLPLVPGDDKLPASYETFTAMGVTFLEDEPAVEGEEDLLNLLNQDSELAIVAGGQDKVARIVEHAANGDESYDDIMAEWNQRWTDAQEAEGALSE